MQITKNTGKASKNSSRNWSLVVWVGVLEFLLCSVEPLQCILIIFIMRKGKGYKIKSQCKYRLKDVGIIQRKRNPMKHRNMFKLP